MNQIIYSRGCGTGWGEGEGIGIGNVDNQTCS